MQSRLFLLTFWLFGAAFACHFAARAEEASPQLQSALIGRRIDEYNVALAEEVRGFRSAKQITYQSDWHGSIDDDEANRNTSGGTFVFGPTHVSRRDCFHPSIAGQNAIADLVLRRANFEP